MTRTTSGLILVAAGLAGCWLVPAGTGDAKVPYPEGYRGWAFLHATIIGPKHSAFEKRPCEKPCTGGIYYFYANDKAMEGLRTGKFADGAVFADELLETSEKQGGVVAVEGTRRGVGVMVRDSQRYASTGGWGYAAYDGDSHTDNFSEKEKDACYQCHVSRKDHDYVFTQYTQR